MYKLKKKKKEIGEISEIKKIPLALFFIGLPTISF